MPIIKQQAAIMTAVQLHHLSIPLNAFGNRLIRTRWFLWDFPVLLSGHKFVHGIDKASDNAVPILRKLYFSMECPLVHKHQRIRPTILDHLLDHLVPAGLLAAYREHASHLLLNKFIAYLIATAVLHDGFALLRVLTLNHMRMSVMLNRQHRQCQVVYVF